MKLAKTTKIIIAIDLSLRAFLWIRDKDFGVTGVLWAVFWIAVYIGLQRLYEYADRKFLADEPDKTAKTQEPPGTKLSDVLSPAEMKLVQQTLTLEGVHGIEGVMQKAMDTIQEAQQRQAANQERLARIWRGIIQKRQKVILGLALAILCGVVMFAPRYVQIPNDGGYIRLRDTASFKDVSPRVDWDWVIQRGLPVVLVAAALLYTVRGRQKKP